VTLSRFRARQGVAVLGPADLPDFLELAARHPVVNAFAEYRARSTNLEGRLLAGEIWGRYDAGELVAACHVGANLVPVECTRDDAQAFAERALTRPRSVVTIVGPQDQVWPMWDHLSESWGPARETRWDQPHKELADDPHVTPDPAVRRSTPDDFAVLYPACVAMYTEEVGVDPESDGGAPIYRSRVRQLIGLGWSFARIEEGRVVFKAEVAHATPHAAQIQGVWVAPERRGEGIAAAGVAAVAEACRRDIAPVVSLYANIWNEPARRAYERVGFRQTETFATVMF
jgi:predicted GNAT family acetyltransferase